MYGEAQTAGEMDWTAFRRAEKKYKLYKSQNPKSRKNQSIKETDLSDVVDFRAVLESFKRNGETPGGIYLFGCPDFHLPVFCFNLYPSGGGTGSKSRLPQTEDKHDATWPPFYPIIHHNIAKISRVLQLQYLAFASCQATKTLYRGISEFIVMTI